jgi:hypothetical protein
VQGLLQRALHGVAGRRQRVHLGAWVRRAVEVRLAEGGSAITCPSPLNVLKDAFDHSYY